MDRRTNRKRTNRKRTNRKRRIIKNKKQGGYTHRRVSLHCTPDKKEYPIICNVCGMNDYIERHTTLGKSKGNQAFANLFIGDTIFEDINNVTIISYFCIKCGMSKIVRGDKNYIKPRLIPPS